MKTNHCFAERLRTGERLIGTLLSLNSSANAEILARLGYDWLFIDAEHGAFSPQDAQNMLQAADPCPCVIRVPAGDEIWIKKALDIGAAGIIVPQINEAKQAEQIINWAKYSPQGNRGVGIGRAHRYGIEFEDTIKNANRNTAVILQAESKAAVENIDSILAVPGIDAILIGPYDLSASLGKIGEVTDDEIVSAIHRVRDACLSRKIQLGIFGVSPEAVRPYMEQGFNLITVGVDTLFLIKSAQETLTALRG